MMSELGEGAKIPDLWRMSALLEICPKDVKEQMLLRLDEVGENYENLKVKVISYTSNKAEQSRGQKETAVPMELDYVSGSEMYDEEEWDDVDEVKRDRRCHNNTSTLHPQSTHRTHFQNSPQHLSCSLCPHR